MLLNLNMVWLGYIVAMTIKINDLESWNAELQEKSADAVDNDGKGIPTIVIVGSGGNSRVSSAIGVLGDITPGG